MLMHHITDCALHYSYCYSPFFIFHALINNKPPEILLTLNSTCKVQISKHPHIPLPLLLHSKEALDPGTAVYFDVSFFEVAVSLEAANED